MLRLPNASAAVKNAGEIGCSQMLKIHCLEKRRSMESNNSYNQLYHTIIKQQVHSSGSCPMNDIVPS